MKYLFVAALLFSQTPFAMGDDSAKELVEKAVARDEQVFSGRIKWIDVAPRGPESPPYFQTFYKDDWVVGGKGYGGVEDWGHPAFGWYKNQAVRYVGDKKVDVNSPLAKPAIEVEDSRRHGNVTLPRWAGGFFSRKMKQWAKQFPGQFHFIGDDAIDGIPVKLVEAETRDPAPFRHGGLRHIGGKIRLFVAPQLGYVIPRAEERTLDGSLRVRYEASEFTEKSPRIWFPMLLKQEQDGLTYAVKFLDVQMLNQEIPASDFCVETIEDGKLKPK